MPSSPKRELKILYSDFGCVCKSAEPPPQALRRPQKATSAPDFLGLSVCCCCCCGWGLLIGCRHGWKTRDIGALKQVTFLISSSLSVIICRVYAIMHSVFCMLFHVFIISFDVEAIFVQKEVLLKFRWIQGCRNGICRRGAHSSS